MMKKKKKNKMISTGLKSIAAFSFLFNHKKFHEFWFIIIIIIIIEKTNKNSFTNKLFSPFVLCSTKLYKKKENILIKLYCCFILLEVLPEFII